MSAVGDDRIVDLDAARRADERRSAAKSILERLAKSAEGIVLPNLANLVVLLELDPTIAGICAHDEFTGDNVICRAPPSPSDAAAPQPGPYPRPWTSADAAMIRSYIQRVWINRASRDELEEAMNVTAHMRRLHAPRDWLNSLQWDGKPRLDTWLSNAFGAKKTDYHQAVGRCFLIAAVRRIRTPGCKFDHIPVLEGPQDIGKSRACRALFTDEWFTDTLPAALESRDAALGLQGVWCVEFAELEQIIKSETEIIKAFLSRAIDRYRPPYGRGFVYRPRQCVLIGTTNVGDYLRDSTGNRRFWPIRCQFADIEWIEHNRAQLFAEAAQAEAAGESHWLHDDAIRSDAKTAQEARLQDDVWTDRVLYYVSGLVRITTSEILSGALDIPIERQSRREQMRVAFILRAAGWGQVVRWSSEGKTRREWSLATPGAPPTTSYD